MNLHKSLQAETPRLLASFPLFQRLGEARLGWVASRSRERKLDRNEILFQKGDAAHSLYLVVYGQVKLALPAANGNEKVVELVGPRQCFGEVALLAGNPYPVLAQAVSETLLAQVPGDVLSELLDSDPGFSRGMLTCLANRTHTLIRDVEAYTQQTSAQRVISFLQHHCLSDSMCADNIEMTLPAPKQVIASRLNLTPETLSRIFHDLTEANLIEVQGKNITINSLKRLREYDL